MGAVKQAILALLICLTALLPTWGWAQSVQRVRNGGIVKWHTQSVDFFVDPSFTRHPTFPNAVELMRAAVRPWEQANPHIPRFQVQPGELGDIGYHALRRNRSGVRLYREHFPQERAHGRPVLALTLLTRITDTGEVVDADILIDGRYPFQVLSNPLIGVPNAPYDLSNSLTHEVGHALGLDHDTDPCAAMYYLTQPGEVHKRELTRSDRASIMAAYAQQPATEQKPSELYDCIIGILIAGLIILVTTLIILVLEKRGEKRVPAIKTSVVIALVPLLLIVGYPSIHPRTTEYGLVVRSQSFWSREGVMRTIATVETAHGRERIMRLGGRIGAYEQSVLDAPSGDELKRGTRVPLHN